MSKNQFTGTATQPQCNRKFCQFNKDQYCNNRHLRYSTKLKSVEKITEPNQYLTELFYM